MIRVRKEFEKKVKLIREEERLANAAMNEAENLEQDRLAASAVIDVSPSSRKPQTASSPSKKRKKKNMADNLTQKLFPGSDPLAIPVPPSSRPSTYDYYRTRTCISIFSSFKFKCSFDGI
jgi:hypothetical protein